MSTALQLVVDQPDASEIRAESSLLVADARSITITDEASYTAACQFLLRVAAMRKAIVSKFAEPKQKAHEAHKAVVALETELLEPTKIAEAEAKKRISAYEAAERARAEAERRRLEEEARHAEEERRLAEALEAEAAGDTEAAEEIISEPIAPPPVRVPPPVAKVAGISYRETWGFELTSLLEVVRHIAAHPEDLNLIQLNTTAVRQMVNARKSLCKIPGIRVYSERGIAAGGSRR